MQKFEEKLKEKREELLTQGDEVNYVETSLQFGVLQMANVDRLRSAECRQR